MAAAILVFAFPASALKIHDVTKQLFQHPWSSLELDDVSRLVNIAGAVSEIWAAVGANQECTQVRVLTVVETVRAGNCEECLRLEFARNGDDYSLTSMVLDYTTGDRPLLDAFLVALMKESATDGFKEPSRKSHFTWSDSWSVEDEMRSTNIAVYHDRRGYHLHFDHRRYLVRGVHASPPGRRTPKR